MSVYVVLRIGSEALAMPVGHVLEVAVLGEVAVVPGARPEILGVRTVRGQILPVVDLALLLGIPRTAFPGRLIVAEDRDRRVGFAVEQVSGVAELGDPTEETESDLLAGAMLADGDLVAVIDVSQVCDLLQGAPPLPGAPPPGVPSLPGAPWSPGTPR